MQFDWIAFLTRHRIDYVTSGANVGPGNIGVHCPWCKDGDPSFHLGISLSGKGFNCWRSRAHRGRNPARLIAALLNISLANAQAMIGHTASPSASDKSLHGLVSAMMTKPDLQYTHSKPLEFPSEIKPLRWSRTGKPFFNYLMRRGYTLPDAKRIAERFGLRYALSGAFAYRLIVPIHNALGELVSWTGRAIAPDQTIRYKTLSTKCDEPRALTSSSDCLLQEHVLEQGGKTLVVCEGPFDAMHTTTGDIIGTCLFTKLVSDSQMVKLQRLAPRFDHRFLLLDSDAQMTSLAVIERLRSAGYSNVHLPSQFKDPAETPSDVLNQLFQTATMGQKHAAKRNA